MSLIARAAICIALWNAGALQLVGLAEANEQESLGSDLGHVTQRDDIAGLAGQIARLSQARQRSAECFVERCERRGQLLVLRNSDNEPIRLDPMPLCRRNVATHAVPFPVDEFNQTMQCAYPP